MKKIKFSGFILLLILFVMNIHVHVYGRYKEKPLFTLENIQILSSGEFGNGNVKCFRSGSVTCPANDVKVEYTMEW